MVFVFWGLNFGKGFGGLKAGIKKRKKKKGPSVLWGEKECLFPTGKILFFRFGFGRGGNVKEGKLVLGGRFCPK